jgi:hypothetical protein
VGSERIERKGRHGKRLGPESRGSGNLGLSRNAEIFRSTRNVDRLGVKMYTPDDETKNVKAIRDSVNNKIENLQFSLRNKGKLA